jgi:hypothetical protein
MIVSLAWASLGAEMEPPKMPAPQQEHQWLMKFVGDWETDVEMFMEPGKPSEKTKGKENVRSIGGFWILAENKGTYMDKPFTGILTLGYDIEKKRFSGTWVDSMTSHLWIYAGTLNAADTILTLETEGPCPMAPGKTVKFKEMIEFKSPDHRIFTSTMQGDDGTWATMMTINYRRK